MSLFLKIFLWFWLALAVMAGAIFVVTWTTLPDSINPPWLNSNLNRINIYTKLAKQIYDNEGEAGLEKMLESLKVSQSLQNPCFWNREKSINCFKNYDEPSAVEALQKALNSENTEFLQISGETGFATQKFSAENGKTFVFIVRLEHRFPAFPFLWFDLRTRILRLLVIILTAGLGCYLLGRYLTNPLIKLSWATKRFANGDLKTRIDSKRRDEIGQLSRDFDAMAERIENLIVSQKTLNRDISHELRSPLARLNVALEIAKQKTGVENLPILQRIEKESNRLNEMISNILLLSKLETQAETLEKRKLNLSKMLEQVAADADFEAQGKNKAVIISENNNCWVRGNERLLQSAIENVLRNAVRYTPEETTVEVSLTKENDSAVIIIRDFGQGVGQNELDKIFRPFYRTDQSRERKSGGIGLGLAIAKEALHLHQGEISAVNLENGLSVKITLPCVPQ